MKFCFLANILQPVILSEAKKMLFAKQINQKQVLQPGKSGRASE